MPSCSLCGAEFAAKHSAQKLCSLGCQRRYLAALQSAKRLDCVCAHCGIEFKAKTRRYIKYCSRECCFAAGKRRTEARMQRQLDSLAPRTCPICSTVFIPPTVASRLCGRSECRREDDRRKSLATYNARQAALGPILAKQCKQCSLEFTVKRTRGAAGRTVCIPCAEQNVRVFRREHKSHRHRASAAGCFYTHVTRASVVAKHGMKCWICKKAIPIKPKSLDETFSLDHIVPLSLGGWHDLLNVRPAHHRCNSLRGDTFTGQLMLVPSAEMLKGHPGAPVLLG